MLFVQLLVESQQSWRKSGGWSGRIVDTALSLAVAKHSSIMELDMQARALLHSLVKVCLKACLFRF